MSAPIDFYFDFTSPYGYLMSEKIDELAARFGRAVNWHPILLGIVFKETGGQPPISSPLKGPYLLRDVPRSARFLQLAYQHPVTFPVATQAAGRSFYWLQDRDPQLARRFAHAIYRAYFVDGRDIGKPEVVIEIAAALGVAADELNSALALPEVKERLQKASVEAMQRGVFGSPFVLIDGEPFFGTDRLPQIERWLQTGGF